MASGRVDRARALGGAAKRLFDAEKWDEAIVALARVASGETGDDDGNKELADYHRAIALYRARRYADAYRLFATFAQKRDHLKHGETLLWLAKMVDVDPSPVDLGVFAGYTREDIARFHDDAQRELWATLSFLLGRERMREGKNDEARDLFAQVPSPSRFRPAAVRCFQKL